MSKAIITIGGILAALSLSACSQPNITVADSGASPLASETAVSTDPWDNITDFVKYQWDGKTKKALALTAPDSPAFKYSTYQAAADEAYRTNGQDRDWDSYSYMDDSDEGTVTITANEDDGGDGEYVWSDFEVDSQGRIVSWTGASGPLEDALWTKDVTVHTGSTDVELVGAYKSNAGALFIVLDVVSGPNGAQINYTPTYIENGRSNQPTFWVAPTNVAPNTRAYHVYAYEGADFGGKFTADVTDDNYNKQGSVSFKVT